MSTTQCLPSGRARIDNLKSEIREWETVSDPTMKMIDDAIERGAFHSVFVGRSMAAGRKRFATFRTGSAETVATGEGDTAEQALLDALLKMNSVKVKLPGM